MTLRDKLPLMGFPEEDYGSYKRLQGRNGYKEVVEFYVCRIAARSWAYVVLARDDKYWIRLHTDIQKFDIDYHAKWAYNCTSHYTVDSPIHVYAIIHRWSHNRPSKMERRKRSKEIQRAWTIAQEAGRDPTTV